MMLPTSHDSEAPIEQLTLRMRGEFRRSCLYAAVGFILVIALGFALAPNPWKATAIFQIVLVGLVGLWSYVQTWRLRVDGTGIARRRFGLWSYWEWRHFSEGCVTPGDYPLSFRCSARPWWDRHLILECVEPEAAATAIGRHLTSLLPAQFDSLDPAAQVSVPEEVTIGFGLTQRLRVTTQGVELVRRRKPRHLRWDEMRWLKLIRIGHSRRFMYRVELCLLDGESVSGGVNSVRVDGAWEWSSSGRQAKWPRRLESLVPADRWQMFRTEGDLGSRAEGEFRINYWQQKHVVCKRLLLTGTPLLLAMGCAVFVPKMINCCNEQFFPPWWKYVALVCLGLTTVQPSLMIGAFCLYVMRCCARRVRETEVEIARFGDVAFTLRVK